MFKKKETSIESKQKKQKKSAVINHDEICQRAYFISKHRQREGIPGDATSDWIEAERQLFEEAKN